MIYPDKAFYRPNEVVKINISGEFCANIWHLGDKITTLKGNGQLIWTPPPIPKRGYSIYIQSTEGDFSTAIDVLAHWTDAPRYGFLFDFSPTHRKRDLNFLLSHHVNGIQFYDWMYRHDKLMPPSERFIDPLGRELSLRVVRQLIKLAHDYQMQAMPYTAIYAASPPFAEQYPQWGLYDEHNQLYDFADGFLKIMNPESGWRGHFINECKDVLENLPFDGIHVDQYGEPQIGFDKDGKAINLPIAFADTLQELHNALPNDKTLLFNLVHNWPLDAIAETSVDFLYCEIWPPQIYLRDLAEITTKNRQISGGKTPIVAVYIDPQHSFTLKMVECVILANGGYHLVHGENGLYLSDPYFPKAQHPSAELATYLKRIADIGVAYQELLIHAQPIALDIELSEDIWIIPRQTTEHNITLNLLNASADDTWNQPIETTTIKRNVEVNITLHQNVHEVWYVTPDEHQPPRELEFSLVNGCLSFCVPRIETWTLVCIQITTTGGDNPQ